MLVWVLPRTNITYTQYWAQCSMPTIALAVAAHSRLGLTLRDASFKGLPLHFLQSWHAQHAPLALSLRDLRFGALGGHLICLIPPPVVRKQCGMHRNIAVCNVRG